MKHIPVLEKEAIELLNIKPDGTYLDLTLGRAGHSSSILKRLKNGRLIAFDLDESAIKESESVLSKISKNYFLVHANFKYFDNTLKQLSINKVDGILMDLGVSSPQFDDPRRGFSYNYDSLLDMRMDLNNKLTAKKVVNTYSLSELTRIFREYGEEKDAYKIANNIIKARNKKEITTTFELVDIIKKSKTFKELSKIGHPAKQVFQALRIEVNDELNSLKETLSKSLGYLNKDGRLVVISFHSLEDRIVKQEFNKVSKLVGDREDSNVIPINKLEYQLVNKDIITPSSEEIIFNRRAKSAKLRAVRKL